MKGMHALRFVVFCLLVLLLMHGLSREFVYHDRSIWSTDFRIQTYYELPDDSLDVLFLGSSNIMCGINPLKIWADTGLQSYNYCGRAQTFPITYAYLTDALKTQSPECVVIDAWSVFSDHNHLGLADSEFHFDVNMESLSLSPAKLSLIHSNVPAKDRLSYLFPVIKNHNSYKTPNYQTDETSQIYMGYCFVDFCQPFETPVFTDTISDLLPCDREALDRIIQLCSDKGITLLFIKTPVVLPTESYAMLNGLEQYLNQKNIPFYELSVQMPHSFTFTEGLSDATHLNTLGAGQVTDFVSELLSSCLPHTERATHQYAHIWAQEYERMKADRATKEAVQ